MPQLVPSSPLLLSSSAPSKRAFAAGNKVGGAAGNSIVGGVRRKSCAGAAGGGGGGEEQGGSERPRRRPRESRSTLVCGILVFLCGMVTAGNIFMFEVGFHNGDLYCNTCGSSPPFQHHQLRQQIHHLAIAEAVAKATTTMVDILDIDEGLRRQKQQQRHHVWLEEKSKKKRQWQQNNKSSSSRKIHYNSSGDDENNELLLYEPQVGILSLKDPSYFDAFRQEIDELDPIDRCIRYAFYHRSRNTTTSEVKDDNPVDAAVENAGGDHQRRIYYGAIIANEPWEMYEIVAAESYGIYEGIVLVESNRTQSYAARNITRYNSTVRFQGQIVPFETAIGSLFGVNKVEIRLYVSEDDDENRLRGLARESAQRNEVLLGWKAMGMVDDDIGVLGDLDEVFTRDLLQAVQSCPGMIPELDDYKFHECRPDITGLRGTAQIYEGSPECITEDRIGFHPSLFPGSCIEHVSSKVNHKPAPRKEFPSWDRSPGWGRTDWNPENDPYGPLVSGGDFRLQGGAKFLDVLDSLEEYYGGEGEGSGGEEENESGVEEDGRGSNNKGGKKEEEEDKYNGGDEEDVEDEYKEEEEGWQSLTRHPKLRRSYEEYTSYHFHNFFVLAETIRFKYNTYGHSNSGALELTVQDLHNDLALMSRCVQDVPDPPDSSYRRLIGGFEQLNPGFVPIYFRDAEYRRRRQRHMRHMIMVQEVEWMKKRRSGGKNQQRNESVVTARL